MPHVCPSPSPIRSPFGRVACLFCALLFSACGEDDPTQTATPLATDTTDTQAHSLLVLAEREGSLERFLEALEVVEMKDLLSDLGPYTVFAPIDEAFRQRGANLDSLFTPAHADSLQKLISYHFMRGRLLPEEIQDSLRISTLLDLPILLERSGPDQPIQLRGRQILRSMPAQNGVLHVIDDVLTIPPPDTSGTSFWETPSTE